MEEFLFGADLNQKCEMHHQRVTTTERRGSINTIFHFTLFQAERNCVSVSICHRNEEKVESEKRKYQSNSCSVFIQPKKWKEHKQ
mmetsp:Transcript_21128/g.47906  ORF Transcript_21128/g.47906 Transcript_21128/m.47906 type:complete len:85 (+) Transcript_21128:1734-1988(+)